jgi:hypothetical protein
MSIIIAFVSGFLGFELVNSTDIIATALTLQGLEFVFTFPGGTRVCYLLLGGVLPVGAVVGSPGIEPGTKRL